MDNAKINFSPVVVDNFLSNFDHSFAKKHYMSIDRRKMELDHNWGRYYMNDSLANSILLSNVQRARDIFSSPTLLPTYSLFVEYFGENAKLRKHIDDNACTYTLDLCLYQTEPWDLWVEGKSYNLKENQALAYYGNEMYHWRDKFPNPEVQKVAMMFLHYAEPDHWWFKDGREYIDQVRKYKTLKVE